MNISDKLTQQQFEEILFNIYKTGQESKEMGTAELINEIKRQIMSSMMHKPK
jgi:hypothetical protein